MQRWTREQWQSVVEEWRADGAGVAKDFCTRRGVNYWSFLDWRRKLDRDRDEQPTGFVELNVGAPERPRGGREQQIRIEIAGVSVFVSGDVCAEQLSRALRAVEMSRC